ncbi:MAG: hypothetical protein ISS35_08035 [Kiritimatiellae bacterium]|nr:hypothetical protein [Kiritimatiellia bacterium]
MQDFLTTATVAVIFFGLAIAAMAIGLILRGKVMRGGCGSSHDPDAPDIGCDACSKKRLNLCDDEDSSGLAGPSFVATMGRFSKKHSSL